MALTELSKSPSTPLTDRQTIYDLYNWFKKNTPVGLDLPLVYPDLPPGMTRYNFTAGFFEEVLIGWVRQDRGNSEHADIIRMDYLGPSGTGEIVFSRNGEIIPNAQDPAIVQINGKNALAVVEANPDPTRPGFFTTRSIIYGLSNNGEKLIRSDRALGPINEKDVRVADLGAGNILIVPRERIGTLHATREELVESYLQGGVVKIDGNNLSELSAGIEIVRKDPTTKLQVLADDPQKNLWFGANSLMPLQKEGRYRNLSDSFMPVGEVYHTAQFYGEKLFNGHRRRPYFAVAVEKIFSRESGRVVWISSSRIIGAVSMLKRQIPGKEGRPDIDNVYYPGDVLVGLGNNGQVETCYLTYGANDRQAGFLRINYPYSARPVPELNLTKVVHQDIMNKYFPTAA